VKKISHSWLQHFKQLEGEKKMRLLSGGRQKFWTLSWCPERGKAGERERVKKKKKNAIKFPWSHLIRAIEEGGEKGKVDA